MPKILKKVERPLGTNYHNQRHVAFVMPVCSIERHPRCVARMEKYPYPTYQLVLNLWSSFVRKHHEVDISGNIYGFTTTCLHLPQWVCTWMKAWPQIVEEYFSILSGNSFIIFNLLLQNATYTMK